MLKVNNSSEHDSITLNRSHVMISYAHKNRQVCDKLYEILNKYLYCWRDVEQLPGASDLWSCIADAIVRADFVVALLSPEYETSESCKNEFAFALNRGILFIPIFIHQKYTPAHTIDIRIIRLLHFYLDDIIENPSILYSHIVRLWVNHNGKSATCRAYKPELSIRDYMSRSATATSEITISHHDSTSQNDTSEQYVSIGKVLEGGGGGGSDNTASTAAAVLIEVHDGPNFEMDNCEYKTEGKPVKLNNVLFQTRPKTQQQKTPTNVFKLLFRNEDMRCVEIVNETTILLVNKQSEFYLIIQNDHSNFQHLKLVVNKKQVDASDSILDMAYEHDTSQLYVLNKFNIEIYTLDVHQLRLDLQNELTLVKNTDQHRYSRIYINSTDTDTFTLVDRLNNRIYWYNKKTYQKKRCVKAINGSIVEPHGFLSTKNNSIYVISKAGLLVCNQESTILHSTLNTIVDIAYDHDTHLLYFIDSTALFFINLNAESQQHVFKKYRKLISIQKFNDVKYKEFRRIVLNKKFIYLLTTNNSNSDCISTVFAIERKLRF